MSLCMCLDMFKYAWSILKKREVIITKIILCVLLLFSLLNCLPLNKIKLLDDSRLTFVDISVTLLKVALNVLDPISLA
jgi:hypothetical protein